MKTRDSAAHAEQGSILRVRAAARCAAPQRGENVVAAPKLPKDEQNEGIHVLSEAESWETFDKRAQYFLGISGPLIGVSPYAPVGDLEPPC
jgi:hypothetical protein